MIKTIRSKFRRDGGFSLLEVSIATAIMAIGLAIAVPQFGKALETASQNEVKTNLLQAGMIVENERYIDEGLYPTNMPQEMIDSTVMSEFRYTYNDERTIYCIMGRTDTREKWYYGSEYTEPYVATTDNPPCTQENLGVGSKALGEAPIMSTPIVAGNNTWDFNSYDYAIATMSWAGATCAASASDPDPGYVQSIEYQSRIVNLDTGETILVNEGAWSQATGANDVSLNGWLPDDRISYETRMRCNYDYETYYDDWASTNGEVSTFPVSASLVADAPAPSIEWTSTQQYAVLSYEGTPIACPSVATPAYRPIANQSGKPTVTGQWGNTTQFDLSLTNFAPNANAEFSVESGCKVGSVYYVANGPAKTTVAGTATKVILVPAMAPAPVTGLKCVTKYNRQYESSRGNCDVDTSIAAATTTPDAVKWNYTACASGFTVEYLVRRASPAATGWTSAGSNSYFTFGNNSGVTPGSTVTYEVKSQCSGNGITSAESDAASISFISSWRPPTDAPLTFTWTGSIDDSSWVETTNFGDAPLNDRIIGTSTLCSNNTTPYGYVVTMKNVNTGATASITLNSSNLVLNRSAWSGANNVWAKGADIQLSAQAKCADPFGDYADITTTNSSYGNTVPVGYPTPDAVTQVNCVTAYQRITEVNKGNCIYDPTVTAPISIEYLVVAGGGGGGVGNVNEGGGGAGAGGMLTGTTQINAGSYTVTVGAGGASAPSVASNGSNGGNSSALGQTAIGGGGGGSCWTASGNTGGSGGGGGGCAAGKPGAAGTVGQGNAGGRGQWTGSTDPNNGNNGNGGGGGGAAGAGQSGADRWPYMTTSAGSIGGAGVGKASDITGTQVVYATGGNGGAGRSNHVGADGASNTGNGGSGSAADRTAGRGGSGIVVVRYLSSVPLATGGVITQSGGYVIHTFTSSGTLTFSTEAAQTYTPDVIRWTAATCYSGYTPSYSMRRADTGESWTNVGNVTQAVPSTATTGANIEATYEVKYQCVNGSRKSEDSGVSSKTFISSLKPISSAAMTFTWTGSTEDSSWNDDTANNGYYFYDRFVATAATPCSNGSQPQGYNLQIDRSGKGTPQSLNGQVIPSISRGQIANADTYWPMGAKMVVRAQAICGDPYGDYANVPSTWSAWSPEFAIAIAAPEAPSIGSNNLWGHFTWGGSGCGYVPASNLQYYATQTQYGGSYGSWHVYGWGAGTEGDVPNYSEGSAISTNTVARCVSEYGIVSPNSEPAVQSWTSGINGSTYVYMPRMHTGAVDGICRSGTWETNLRQYARSAGGINGGWFYEKEHSYTNGTWGNVYAVSGYSTCTNGSQSSFEHHGYLVGPGYPTESMDYIVY